MRKNLHYFQTESESVAYAFAAITSDTMANRHLIGLVTDAQEQALLTELDARGVRYWKDEIPFGGLHDKRSRIFIFGCDIHRVADLLEKIRKMATAELTNTYRLDGCSRLLNPFQIL